MPDFTIIAVSESPAERELLDAWVLKWRERVAFISENKGCGCCVDIYDVSASEEAMREIPREMLSNNSDNHGHRA